MTNSKNIKREEIFKFNDDEGLEVFKEITTTTNKLTKCIKQGGDLNDSTKKFAKNLNNITHQSFNKVRVRAEINLLILTF